MPQVPYNPVPQQGLSPQPIPELRADAPADAFGSGIGVGLSAIGREVQQFGDEVFRRAMAMQQLNNEAEAREAETEYILKTGELHAEYNSLQGRAAVDAYPAYQQNLKALREEIREKMSNPMSRRMYDSATRTTMARTIFNGASHAASQNRQWVSGTLQGNIDIKVKAVEDDPNNDKLFQNTVREVRQATRELAELKGYDAASPATRAAELEATSKLWSQRIIGLSRTKPLEAARLLDENKTALTQQDFLRSDQVVRSSARAVGTANLVNEVWAGGGTMEQMRAEVKRRAEEEFPDDPLYEKQAQTGLNTKFNQDKYIEKQEQTQHIATIEGAILGGATSMQELRADPAVAAAIDAMPEKYRNDLPGRINRAVESRMKQTNQANFLRINGLKSSDPEAFLNLDMTNQQLSHSDMVKMINEQQRMKGVATADPRVQRALGSLRGAYGAQLEALGVYRRTEDNKEMYDKFVGALQIALDDWVQTYQKPPTYRDIIDTIGPQIMQQRLEPSSFFGKVWPDKRPFYDQTVPTEFAEKVTADVLARGLPEPTPEQIYRAWTQKEFLRLYGAKKDQSRAR